MRHHFVRSSAGLRDPNFKNVTLLLHGDGTNGGQNNTFLDSSGSNNAITRTGNVAQGSFSPYGDRWSVALAGSSAHLRSANNANLNIGASDFTFECWANGSSFSTDWATFFARWNSNGNYGYFFNYDTDGGLTFIYSTTGLAAGNVIRVYGGTMTVGKWHHVAFCRSGGTTRAFLDGVQIGSATSDNVTIFNSNGQQVIGGVLDAATIYHPFTGYISNLRLVIGTALYTSNFTPSSSPLTVIANTRILACASNRFEDKSPTALTLNPNGTPSVQRFSPFGPDTLYRTDRIGGSAYFDGSGDWLQVANRGLKLTAGFFTAECWVYITAYSGNFYALFEDRYWQGGHNGGWCVFINSAGQIVMQASNGNWNNWGGTFITSSNSVIRGQWNHVAVVRGANDLINIYINGVSTTTPVAKKDLNLNSGSAQSAWESRIGVHASDIIYGGSYSYLFTGTISDLRVINGKCLYTANFTPPTGPLTAIPETTFLGRFANASIVDNAMMNNLETVGNAQISTSIKKYGTGSLYFDGTGDWLLAPNYPSITLEGDFTIEAWVYILAGGANRGIITIGDRSTATGITLMWQSSAYFKVFTSGAELLATNTTTATNTWAHFALTRNGTGANNMKTYLNGIYQQTNGTANNNIFAGVAGNGLCVGVSYSAGSFIEPHNGYICDLRITKGVARYTGNVNFNPPTAPFPDF